jgi:hypothetical protein
LLTNNGRCCSVDARRRAPPPPLRQVVSHEVTDVTINDGVEYYAVAAVKTDAPDNIKDFK